MPLGSVSASYLTGDKRTIHDNPMKNKKWKVYRYTCLVTDKSYIGMTQMPLEQRSRRDMSGYRGSTVFWNAIQKHGVGNFTAEILHDGLSKTEAERLETLEIERHNSIVPYGYNLKSGGNVHSVHPDTRQKLSEANRGRKPSEETRQKLSEARRGRKFSDEHRQKLSEANRGKRHTAETRKKISEVQRGKKFSPETRQKLSEARRRRKISDETRKKISEAHRGKKLSDETRRKISESLRGPNNPNYGKSLSDEHRQKLSKAHRGKKLSPESIRKRSEARRGKKLSPESIRKRSATVRRKSQKAIWMFTRTLALYYFYTHD